MSRHESVCAVALDLGSSSGLAVLGTLAKDRLEMAEVHRFPHEATLHDGALIWDVDLLSAGVRDGVAAARRAADTPHGLSAVGVDTWGVDYALLNDSGDLVRPPRAYRDTRMQRHLSDFEARIAAPEQWAATGIQPADINTSIQLFADLAEDPSLPERVARVLLLPDYFTYALGGGFGAGRAIASSSGLATPGARAWSESLIEAADVPRSWLPALVDDRSVAGYMPESETAIVRPGGHDTAGAVHALGLSHEDVRLFISCGSWSLVGVTLAAPVVTEVAYREGLTNEVRTDGGIRLLRNLTGLWLLQECERVWAAAGERRTTAQLVAAAAEAPSLGVVVDPGDEAFMRPGDMPSKLARACQRRYGIEPTGIAQTARLVVESLACAHADTVAGIDHVVHDVLDADSPLHLIGGGSRNTLLAQMTADACHRPVVAGPAEASAAGNLLAQFEAIGALDPADRADIIAASFSPATYEPSSTSRFDAMRERLH